MNIGYLGPKGTFSYAAVKKICKDEDVIVEYPTIFNLIKAVDEAETDCAVVPIENMVEGSVNPTLDTLAFNADVFITGEFILSIEQNLLVKKGVKEENIREIASMSQPVGQCQQMINECFPDAKIIYTNSTAEAAKLVSESDSGCACIASSESAEIYGLEILKRNCSDNKNNCTKFVIIEKKPSCTVTDADKSSIVFAVGDKPGALFRILKHFEQLGINMTRIESRPSKRKLGEYIFFVDIDGNVADENIYNALDRIKKHSEFYKFLGSYKTVVS